jgi:hypothetical protein
VMKNKSIAEKIEKLIAAGVLRMGWFLMLYSTYVYKLEWIYVLF